VREHGEDKLKRVNSALGCALIGTALFVLFLFIWLVTYHTSGVYEVNSTISAWNKEDMAEDFESIRLKMKVMPSIGTGVNWQMTWVDKEEPGYEK
jgi:hypothetical protein